MATKQDEKLAQEVAEMKESHEEKCAEMRKRWKPIKKKKRPYVRRRSPFASSPPAAYKPLPPPGDPKDVIASVKEAAREFCRHNCAPEKIGHHVGCAFWLWDENGCLRGDS